MSIGSPLPGSCLWLIAALCLTASLQAVSHKAKSLEELELLKLIRENNSWIVDLNVAHKKVKLEVKMEACRSWVKSSLCKVCGGSGGSCSSNISCSASEKEPKISCDSSYCQRGADYEDETSSIQGFSAEIFGKLANSQQTLIPLVFANKIEEPVPHSGHYCLLDADSAFNQGIIVLNNKNIEVINAKTNAKAAKQLREAAFESSQIKMDEFQLGFEGFAAVSASISNAEPLAYRTVSYQAKGDFKVSLSLEQLGITVPEKMFQELQGGIRSVYFPSNECRISAGKIKCAERLDFGGLSQAMLQLSFKQNFVLSLPVHMLISSCAAKSCTLLLDSHNASSVIVGSVFLQALAVEWDLDSRQLWLHRLNNQWADPYRAYKIEPDKRGFLANMFTLLFHIFLYLLYCILALAAVSLLLNCLLRWEQVAAYLKGIAGRLRRRKQPPSALEEEEYFVSEIVGPPEPRGRRVNRLQEPLDDDDI